MNHKVSVRLLLEIADDLQSKPYKSDTELHIASVLYGSVENWEQAIIEKKAAKSAVESEHTYWLSFAVFHSATALSELSKMNIDGLDSILDISKRVMNDHKPSDMVITL